MGVRDRNANFALDAQVQAVRSLRAGGALVHQLSSDPAAAGVIGGGLGGLDVGLAAVADRLAEAPTLSTSASLTLTPTVAPPSISRSLWVWLASPWFLEDAWGDRYNVRGLHFDAGGRVPVATLWSDVTVDDAYRRQVSVDEARVLHPFGLSVLHWVVLDDRFMTQASKLSSVLQQPDGGRSTLTKQVAAALQRSPGSDFKRSQRLEELEALEESRLGLVAAGRLPVVAAGWAAAVEVLESGVAVKLKGYTLKSARREGVQATTVLAV